MSLLQPGEKVSILASMGMKWDYTKSTCDVFAQSMVVIPVSWVSEFVLVIQEHLQEEDARLKLHTEWYGKLDYAGQKRAIGGFFPPASENALIREMRIWNKRTKCVETNADGAPYSRRTHTYLDSEYSNYPVTDLFITHYGGRAMACAIAKLCSDFSGSYGDEIIVDLPVLVSRSPEFYISNCQSKYYKSSVFMSGKTWDMNDCVKHFQKPSLLLKWIKDEIDVIPVEMRATPEEDESDLEIAM